nr:MAG TPA: hypothetical protein [Caudoviricetes sp.]
MAPVKISGVFFILKLAYLRAYICMAAGDSNHLKRLAEQRKHEKRGIDRPQPDARHRQQRPGNWCKVYC